MKCSAQRKCQHCKEFYLPDRRNFVLFHKRSRGGFRPGERLPVKMAMILSEEHKAVLLVVIGYRQKGGVSKARVGEILGLEGLFIPGRSL
jgi:hypothetical protein